MKKGCLGRFVVFLLVIGCAGLGYEDYSLYQDKVSLQNQLSAAQAKLDQMRVDRQSSHAGGAGKPAQAPPAEDAWLNQAQQHANKAAEDIKNLDPTGAYNESKAAMQALSSQPKHMTADMRQRYDSVQKQLTGIKDKAQGLFNNVVGG